jgi:hypothetical protein
MLACRNAYLPSDEVEADGEFGNGMFHLQDPDGRQEIVVEDADAAHLAEVEEAYLSHSLGRPHLDICHSLRLRNISSLAFGGPDLRTAYLGCLLGSTIGFFSSPVAGAPPPHWSFPLGPLADAKTIENSGDAS